MMNPSATCIDDLPPEMIRELFKHLSLKDLAACSMVNKLWHSIYAAFKLHMLAAIGHPFGPSECKWYDPNQPIREAQRCCPAVFRRLVEKPLISNLRQLSLCDFLEFDLNELNRFQQLVHLEIDIRPVRKAHLNLPRLRVLAFYTRTLEEQNPACHLSVDCPKLSTLLYNARNANFLDVKHPETIKKLETKTLVGSELAQFKNVECLVTCRFQMISKATLISLPRLRELHYDWDIAVSVGEEFNNALGSVDRMKRTLREFMNKAKRLRGSDFQFTFSGFQLTNVNVDQIDFGLEVHKKTRSEYVHNEYVYMKNYHLIAPGALHFISFIHYNRLLSHVTGEFPRCFSQKFTGIEWVRAGQVPNADHFLWFLKSLRFLSKLELTNTGLGQEFFDQLPASARSLDMLELIGDTNELQLNFDFIGKFSESLSELEIHQQLTRESLTSLVRWLGRLETTRYVPQSVEYRIEKQEGSAAWEVYEAAWVAWSPFVALVTENPEEIVNFFEWLY